MAAVLAGLTAPVARADLRDRVVLLRPPLADAVTSDATARVRGELTAAGFEVTVVPQDPQLEIRAALETVGRELDPLATFAILRAPGGSTAEIWVCDRVAGKSVIQTVRLDGAAAPAESRAVVLAVEAVELLKGSLAQHWLTSGRPDVSPRPPPALAPPAVARAELPAGGAGPGLWVEAALGRLDSAGEVTAAWQPIVRVGWGARGWAARASAVGLGTDAQRQASSGTARIGQALAVLEIVREFRARARVRPFVSAGAGALRARVVGTGVGPYVGRAATSWSGLVTAGGGMSVRLLPHVALAVDAQIMVACPYTAVRLPSVEAANVAWPALLLSAGLRAGFP
ncbi:MAG TPA: hypothetical protein VHM31_10095 [Polyangia bacterium]|nr:hypothetical protein [Polyangia bacterium]